MAFLFTKLYIFSVVCSLVSKQKEEFLQPFVI